MNREALLSLHELTTEARDAAHKAYTLALRVRRGTPTADTGAAYDALLKANRVRDRIYAALLDATATQALAPVPEPPAPVIKEGDIVTLPAPYNATKRHRVVLEKGQLAAVVLGGQYLWFGKRELTIVPSESE